MKSITFKRILRFLQLAPTILTHAKAIWELVCEVITEENINEIKEAAKLGGNKNVEHTDEK